MRSHPPAAEGEISLVPLNIKKKRRGIRQVHIGVGGVHGGVKGCLVTLVGSAPSSPLSARFMWVDLQLEASSETAGMNVIQWQQSSTQRKVCLCGAGRMHASPALLLFCPPATAPRRAAPHRTAPPCPAVDRPSSRERSGSRLLLSPFVGRALLVGRPQILLVDVIDTPCLLP